MTATITKDNLFKPKPSRTETKHSITNREAWTIIEKNADELKAKTERLKKARLEMESQRNAEQPVTPVRKKKQAVVRRAKSSM